MDERGRQRVSLASLFFTFIFSNMKRRLWVLGGLVIAGLIVFAANAFWQSPPPPPRPVPQLARDIRVEILNGCGTPGIAGQMGEKLREFGVDVMTLGNAENFNFPETMVIDRMGKIERGRQIAAILGTSNVIQQKTPDAYRLEEVTIIIGRDYEELEIWK